MSFTTSPKLTLTGFLYSVLFLFHTAASGQAAKAPVQLRPASQPVRIDGLLDEDCWKTATKMDNFWNLLDTGHARMMTAARVTYDDNYIYIGAVCYTKRRPVVKTLKRDTDPWGNDGFFVVLDPVNEKRNGYIFGVNAQGAQTDGTIEVNNMNTDWNTTWLSATHIDSNFYSVEIAIPFSSIRFRQGNRLWGINFIRSDMYYNQYSNWSYVQLQWNGFNLNFTGQFEFADAPKSISSKRNVLQPYVTATATKDNLQGSGSISTNLKAGTDAKIAVGSSLSLDLTVNPDFSQIEVDQQVINLDRFNVQLPERRTFFLENNELFTDFGLDDVKPFLSRQIGISADGRQKSIPGGIRLTGNLNHNLRIGVLDIVTDRFEKEAAQNYMVGVFEQKVLDRSSIKGIFADRDGLGGQSGPDFNRAAGLEFNYLSPDNRQSAFIKTHYSFNDFSTGHAQFELLGYNYVKNKISTSFLLTNVGDNYNPEMGFSPYNLYYDPLTQLTKRKGYTQLWNSTTKLFRPASQTVRNLSFTAGTYYNVFSDNTFWEAANVLSSTLDFMNTSSIQASSTQKSSRLPYDSEFVGEKVTAGKYWFSIYNLSYSTDRRKNLGINVFGEIGNYYGGYRHTYGMNLDIHSQPYFNFSLGANLNRIALNGKTIDLQLLNSKAEFNFSKNFFWTSFLQYNTQVKNFNVNSRLQWRFAPLSDLYIVYTDNYDTDGFKPQNKTLAIKLNYWLNI